MRQAGHCGPEFHLPVLFVPWFLSWEPVHLPVCHRVDRDAGIKGRNSLPPLAQQALDRPVRLGPGSGVGDYVEKASPAEPVAPSLANTSTADSTGKKHQRGRGT